MLTFEDLAALSQDEKARADFVLKLIGEYQASPAYKTAVEAQAYYDGENPTIMRYEKILYDMAGRAHVDMWTANHKIASAFFTFVIDQEISYLLGNGVLFGQDGTKDRLGEDFDQEMMDALEAARIGGTAYGFWNLDHVEVFTALEFAPLYGEETGALMAGVRFWQLAADKPLRATLYEPDGYTEFIKRKGQDLLILRPKRAYKQRIQGSQADGQQIVDGENYAGFPVVPLYANKSHKSALIGRRNTIDALDLATSNMVNNVDEGSLIYWVLTNCGGMDDLDDARFIERLKTLHVSHADGDAGASATAHTVEAPFEGTKVTIDMLEDRLYADFQAFDAKSMTAADMSATAIRAGYTRIDLKTDKIERQMTRFILGLLNIAGIKDKPSYQRNRLLNEMEETQKYTMQAQWFDDDYIRQKLLALNGDIDMLEEISKRMDAEDANRLKDLEKRLKEMEAQGEENGRENSNGNIGGATA